jgi:hypothetical protein
MDTTEREDIVRGLAIIERLWSSASAEVSAEVSLDKSTLYAI